VLSYLVNGAFIAEPPVIAAYVLTPAILPPLVGAVFLAILSLYSWRRRSVPAALPLSAGSLFGALWLLGIVFEVAAIAPVHKIAWHKFQAAWQLPAATAMACFALEFASPGRWLTRRNLTLLALPPLVVLFVIATSDAQYMWRRLEFGPDGLLVRIFNLPGAILTAYGLSLILINAAAFVWLFVRSPQHRWPVALMLSGDVTARFLHALYMLDARLPSLSLLEAFAAALLLDLSMYAIALFGFRIFDPLPAARRTAIEQMRDGVVILDAQGRIVRLNPAAARILSVTAGRVQGKPLSVIQPELFDWDERLTEAETNLDQICLGTGPGARSYAVDRSALSDFRGSRLGHVLLLHDVTEQRRAQAQIVEQRAALAALAERDRLARELHDGLGQVLGYVKLQARTARRTLEQDDHVQVNAELSRIEAAAQEAHAEIRDFLLGVEGDRLAAQGFHASLLEYVQRYERTYDMMTEVRWPSELHDSDVDPEAQAQLLRIIQEAISNVRRHAGTRAATLSLTVDGTGLCILIHDDGRGFDPVNASAGGDDMVGHYGLRFMRERAEEIGGSLEVASAPGQGADILIRVPIHERKNRGAPAVG